MSSAVAERVQSGFYDSVVEQATTMGPSCLAFANLKEHFYSEPDWGSGTRYVTPQRKVFHTNILGEICGREQGSQISAKGNHFVGSSANPKYITDSSRVKDVIVLRAPAEAPEALLRIFEDQITTLNQIREADAEKEAEDSRRYTIKEWVKTSVGGEIPDLVVITCPPRYVVDEGNSGARLEKRASDGNAKTTPAIPAPDKVRVGALYDPALLPDYKGDLFKLRRAKLVQQEVRDEEGKLIPPWEIYSALRPGTMVLIMVTLHCYLVGGDNLNKRKVYQINAERIRVLAPSDLPIDEYVEHNVPTSDDTEATSMEVAGTAFDQFVPFKRVKTADPARPSFKLRLSPRKGSQKPADMNVDNS